MKTQLLLLSDLQPTDITSISCYHYIMHTYYKYVSTKKTIVFKVPKLNSACYKSRFLYTCFVSSLNLIGCYWLFLNQYHEFLLIVMQTRHIFSSFKYRILFVSFQMDFPQTNIFLWQCFFVFIYLFILFYKVLEEQ